jgi:hypothetical protein
MSQPIGISDVLQTANFREKLIKRKKDEAFETEAGAHLKGFTELGPDYSPEGPYDSRAFVAAQMDHINATMQTEEMKMKINQRRRDDIDIGHEIVLENANKAEGFMSMGNTPEAYKAYEAAYEGFADGTDITINPKNFTIKFDNPDGSEEYKHFESEEAMQKFLKDNTDVARDKTNFALMSLKARSSINQMNAAAWANRKYMENDKGERIQAMLGLRDPGTGQPMQGQHGGFFFEDGMMFYDPKNQRTLTKKQVVEQGFMTQAELQDLAKTKKTKSESKSQLEKVADFVFKVHGKDGISYDTILDYLNKQKISKEKLGMFKVDDFTDLSDRDVREQMMALGLANKFTDTTLIDQLTRMEAIRRHSKVSEQSEAARISAKKKGAGIGGGKAKIKKGLPKAQDPSQAKVLPKGVSEEDVQFTMKKHGMSRDEVISRLTK